MQIVKIKQDISLLNQFTVIKQFIQYYKQLNTTYLYSLFFFLFFTFFQIPSFFLIIYLMQKQYESVYQYSIIGMDGLSSDGGEKEKREKKTRKLQKISVKGAKRVNKFTKTVFRRMFKDQSHYKGDIKGKLRHGFGKHTYADGSFYVGQFRNGKRNGYGQFRDNKKGIKFWGEFQNGLRNGRGNVIMPGEYEYTGYFKDGKMHGEGKIKFNDNSVYTGTFLHGKWGEKGKFVDRNGKAYNLTFGQGKNPGLDQLLKDCLNFHEIKEFIPPLNTGLTRTHKQK